MTTITINGYAYPLPASWLDISIGQLQDITEIQTSMPSSFDREVIETSILTGISEDLINSIPYQEYMRIRGALSFIDRAYPDKMSPVWNHLGVDYEFDSNIENMTTAEFIDFDSLQKKGVEELHTMMAILYKPKTDAPFKYDTNELKKRARLFKQYMPAEIALSAMAFTVVLGQALLASSPAYSLYLKKAQENPETMELTQTLKTLLQNSGAGESASLK